MATQFQHRRSLMSRRLLMYVVMCAFIFSIITTLAQVGIRHKQSMTDLHATFEFIEKSYVDSIAASVFALDEEQVRLLLKGVLNFPHIAHVQVIEERGDQQIQIEEGWAQLSRDMERSFALTYMSPSKEAITFGVLTVSANLGNVYGQLWKNAFFAFIISALGLGVVAFTIYLVFQYSLTRHLVSMCAYTNQLGINQLQSDFKLDRRTPKIWRNDELNQLAIALNKLSLRLNQGLNDIKIREAKLQANAESMRRYEYIISSTNDLMSFVDTDYIYRSVNDAYLKAHAKARKEILGRSVEQLMGTESFHRWVKPNFDRSLKGEQVQYQMWYEYAGAGRRYIDVSYNPFEDSHGHVTGVVVTVHDLTPRKKAEEAISLFFDQSLVMLFVADMETNILIRVNKEVARITGRTEEELVSAPFYAFIHPDDRAATLKAMARVSYGTPMDGFQNRHITANGDIRVFEWNAVPDLEHKLMYAMARDITDQKKSEEERAKLQAQLLQAQKMESVGRLAGGVAHDFNNMLSIIIGHSEMILEDADTNPSLLNRIEEIHKAAQRSSDFVRQLLAFARKQTIAPKVIDLNEALEGMLRMLRRLIGEDIDLAWLPKTDLWRVNIDPSQVNQVLANLCINARDSINGVGKVTIETDNVVLDEEYCQTREGFRPGKFVMIAVSDNGCGIEKENLDKLFEPFFTTKEVGHGTGLGLATVYGIVKQNSGFINVYSESGEGSTFKIYLPPYADSLVSEKTPARNTTVPTGHETILLVEDEEAILKMTVAMLQRLGYNTISATSPAEALQHTRNHSGDIDMLLTDVVMPEMSGRDLAQTLMDMQPSIKCLYMSGYPANIIVHHGVLEEGVQFIHKPFTNQDLAAKIRQVLDEADDR